MITSSNGNIFRVDGPLPAESTGHRWIPLTKTSDVELWCFLYLHLNKRLYKESRRRWLRCHRAHYDVTVMDYRCLHLTANSYLVSIRLLKSCFRLGRHRCPRDWHMKNIMAHVENILITQCISVRYTDVLRYYNIYYFWFLSISHAIWKIVPRMIWVQSSRARINSWIELELIINSIQHELNWNWIERFWIGIELELKASTDRNWSIQSIHFQFNSSFYKVKLFCMPYYGNRSMTSNPM